MSAASESLAVQRSGRLDRLAEVPCSSQLERDKGRDRVNVKGKIFRMP
jgi:hypothetical protein